MKELIKPKKKKEIFENLNVTAFHEDCGSYDRSGQYGRWTIIDQYWQEDSVDSSTNDLLFQTAKKLFKEKVFENQIYLLMLKKGSKIQKVVTLLNRMIVNKIGALKMIF